MVGAAGAKLGRNLRPLAGRQLRCVDAQLVSKGLRSPKDRPRFRRRERWLVAPGVAEDGLCLEGGQHLFHQGSQIRRPVDVRRNDMGAEKGRDDPKRCPRGKLPQDVEGLRLAGQVQPVAGLRLDGGGAVGEESVRAGFGERQQAGGIGRPRRPHGTRNAALARLLCPVVTPAHPLSELIRSGAGEDRVGMGIDQSGDDACARGVELVTVQLDLGVELAILPDPDHSSLARRQGAVGDAAKRIAVIRHHGGQLTGMPKCEVGVDHVAFTSDRAIDAVLAGEVDGSLIAGVGMADHPHPRVGGEHPLQPVRHRRRAVGNHHHASMDRVSDANPTAVMDRDPAGPGGGVHQRVQDGPIGNGVAAITHPLGFAIGGRDRAGIEMIPPDDDRGTQLARLHQFVEAKPDLGALAVAEPADPGRQTLELDALAREPQPAVQVVVVGQRLHDRAVGAIDVLGFAA